MRERWFTGHYSIHEAPETSTRHYCAAQDPPRKFMFLLSIRVGQIGRPFEIYSMPSGGKSLDSRSQCRRRATKKRSMPGANSWRGISCSSLLTTIEHFTRAFQRLNLKRDLLTLTCWDSLGHRFLDPWVLVRKNTSSVLHGPIQ